MNVDAFFEFFLVAASIGLLIIAVSLAAMVAKDNKKSNKPEPVQRNSQGGVIPGTKREITHDELVERAQQVLREIDKYALERRTENQLLYVRGKAYDLLNATIAYRRQCKEAAREFLQTIKVE